MPLIVEILTERDLDAYAAGLLDDRARRSVEQCARHDRRVAARLRSCRSHQQNQARPEPARKPRRKLAAARRSNG